MKTKSKVLVLSLFALSACTMKHESPNWVYAPDMHNGPGLKAQEEGSMRPPVQGTVPRGFRPYHVSTLDEAAKLKNPVEVTQASLKNGKTLFNVFCIVCHGKYGEGNGTVVPKFPQPPSLVSEKVHNFKDGQIFHIISMGQNLMPTYADKLNPEERWEVVHYLRVLYQSKNAKGAEQQKAEKIIEEL